MSSVSIDFVGGSHGQFLEYVCNRFIAGCTYNKSVFNDVGASHNKDNSYYEHAVFQANHFSIYGCEPSSRVIRIVFDAKDLLLLTSVSLLRSADCNINNDLLHENTFYKLNNVHYQDLIADINTAYPEHAISINSVNCPRFVLREFFKFGFRTPDQQGLIKKLKIVLENTHPDSFDFPFRSFYNKKLFLESMSRLSNWYNNQLPDFSDLLDLHSEFLLKNPYVSHQTECDQLVNLVIQGQEAAIHKLTLLQESYINGTLERVYPGLEMPFMQQEYFTNTKDITEYIQSNV